MKTKNTEKLLEEISRLKEEILIKEEENKKLKNRKKYGLVWEDKTEEFDEKTKNAFPILREKGGKFKDVLEKGRENENYNILIEGDNYHSLSVLSYTHKNKIDVIYIDPPYNTGNKDFIYNDKIIDKEDAFRHSKWLSFMNKRLKLAKNLLKDDGVIFISIDDNEQAQLKLLCDEIFGENNFVNNIVVKSSETSGVKMAHSHNKLPKIKENIFVYSKLKYNLKFNPVEISKSDKGDFEKYLKYYSNIITNFDDPVADWKIISLKEFLKGKKMDSDQIKKFKIDNAYRMVYRTNNKSFKKVRVDTSLAEILSPNGIRYIYWEGKQMLFLKDYLTEGLCDLWNDISTINLNKEIVGLPPFKNGQKPIELLKRVIKLKNKNLIILDFFAGSGTTGHAVLDLNKEDGGNRKFILCTNNENKIAEEVTWERIKRVSQGYKKINGEKVEGLGGNLKYLKTDFVQKQLEDRITDEDKLNLTYETGTLLALKENTFKEKIKNKYYQIFEGKDGITGIYFRENKEKLNELLNKLGKEKLPVKLYIFSWEKGAYKGEFEEYKNITAEDIPEPILEVYKNIGL